jgi:hypothetical protein
MEIAVTNAMRPGLQLQNSLIVDSVMSPSARFGPIFDNKPARPAWTLCHKRNRGPLKDE